MVSYNTPGVYQEERSPAPAVELRTGVPVFLGLTQKIPAGGLDRPERLALTRWTEFERQFGTSVSGGYLSDAVRGFFDNGGRLCYVIPLATISEEALRDRLLKILTPLDTIDLVCAPDIMTKLPADAQRLQRLVLDHCAAAGDRFALLDATKGATLAGVTQQRQQLSSLNGALYYPWVQVIENRLVPPCGHIAGVYARTDRRVGVHKAPANEVLRGVLDLEVNLSDVEQDELNPLGINCLRVFPGRGIRIWGARTLADQAQWRYVNVRRLFLTVSRWLERNLTNAVFEPNDADLWARIERELTGYFNGLLRRGALRGGNPEEAFYIKCDGDTNPPEVRDAGLVITEIGLAPSLPNEFIVVRIVFGASGVTLSEQSESE